VSRNVINVKDSNKGKSCYEYKLRKDFHHQQKRDSVLYVKNESASFVQTVSQEYKSSLATATSSKVISESVSSAVTNATRTQAEIRNVQFSALFIDAVTR
jgi:transcriptional regulator NrdR family protein